ncbi:hypothetical protein [Cupriavidus metallidurans]|uniref:hypothetical protein n=1 Tax=Cupriavidus metallidurans TaxID=119219 RepID=UPI0012DA28BC|nr:hypothetical protein [Cupriavidus metallidurans]
MEPDTPQSQDVQQEIDGKKEAFGHRERILALAVAIETNLRGLCNAGVSPYSSDAPITAWRLSELLVDLASESVP